MLLVITGTDWVEANLIWSIGQLVFGYSLVILAKLSYSAAVVVICGARLWWVH